MSGNAFKDFNPKRIEYDDYIALKVIVEHFFKNIAEIGSAQLFRDGIGTHDRTLGDLDFAVELPKSEILKIAKAHPDTFQAVKVFGNTVSTLVYNPEERCVQHVDFMTSTDIDNEEWVMTGGSDRFKGVVRNMMLCYLARVQNAKESTEERTVKHTVAFPSGVSTRVNGEQVSERDNQPSVILQTLGLKNDSESIESARTYEGLLSILDDVQSHYDGFKAYCEESYFYRKSPALLDRALDYLKNFE
tara:strand:+ start:82 stop:819 length:738 start_codon:yes stop_codon:yes gene_type:complete